MSADPPRKVARTPEVLVDHKPADLAVPWSIAFPLDHDALVEVDGVGIGLPAGAVLVWHRRELRVYPASHPIRRLRGALQMPGEVPGHLLWSAPPP